MTELLVYSFNVGEFAAFLKSPPSAIKATCRSKMQKPHVAQIKERMRWLESILAGRKAVDPVFEAELDWDDDAVLESQEYFDSYRLALRFVYDSTANRSVICCIVNCQL